MNAVVARVSSSQITGFAAHHSSVLRRQRAEAGLQVFAP